MTQKKSNDEYSQPDKHQRFEAALRGARLAQPNPLKDIPKKGRESRGSPSENKKSGRLNK